MITGELRKELQALSKEVLGSSSRWQKMLERGTQELLTEDVTEYVPGKTDEDEGTTRVVKLPVKRKDGALQYVIKHYTPESLKAMLLDLKEKRDNMIIQINKMNAEQKAKQALEAQMKKVQETIGGSAA
jgi:hypothetical protein